MTDDIDTLARTIYGESRGEGYIGMAAVACVVMNRVAKKTWYGLTPYEVCMKHAITHSGHTVYQFSCWNADDPNCHVIKDVDELDATFSQCVQTARDAISGKLVDVTGGATHYYDKRMKESPAWAHDKTPCAAIGHHLFFNNID